MRIQGDGFRQANPVFWRALAVAYGASDEQAAAIVRTILAEFDQTLATQDSAERIVARIRELAG